MTMTRTSARSRAHAVAVLLSTLMLGASARADDKAVCAEAYEKGQELRNKGEFTSARSELVLCAKPTCKDWMVAECTKWLDEIERRQPTVVLTAENARGELVDLVKVIDESGRAIAQGATGRAIALDPGPHELTFIARDGSQVKVLKMVQEGQQAISVKAVFATPRAADADASADRRHGGDAPPAPSGNPWRTVGWIAAGAGLAGVGVGAAFGVVALDRKSAAGCDGNGVCDPGTTGSIESAATLSTVAFVAGSALLAGGAALLLLAPSTSPASRRGARITPVATSRGGAVVLGGSF